MPGWVGMLKRFWTPVGEDDETDETDAGGYEDEYAAERVCNSKGHKNEGSLNRSKKVVNLQTTAQLQVVVCKPEHFAEETRNIADELLESYTVVLNLEDTNKEASIRILDFLSGVAYARGGKIKKIATKTYIITPCNVDITGEELVEGLESSGVYF